jgi:hypothetical protein
VLVGCCGGRVVGGWARRTLAIVGLLGHDVGGERVCACGRIGG